MVADFKAGRMVPIAKANYRLVLPRIIEKAKAKEKIRVLFLISDSSKWKMCTLFDQMKSSELFDPHIAVSLYGWHDDLPAAEENGRRTESFFAAAGMPVVSAYSYDEHKAVPLDMFDPDVVFYGQPWDVDPVHDPLVVSRYALTCYVPYYVPNFMFQKFDCALSFHRFLFRYFILSDGWKELAEGVRGDKSSAGEIVATGHPALDVFRAAWCDEPSSGRFVVYAPHWTFPHRDNPNASNISTFLWSGRIMLAYAKQHPEVDWVFKPHPVLRSALIKSGVMSEHEVDEYYSSWERLGRCCYDCDYASVFMQSIAMITDCASFLNEYACTGNPIVRLISSDATVKPCKLSNNLYSTYYQVHSPEELEPMLDKIIIRREDPNREARLAAAKAMNLTGVDAAGNIIAHLEKLIWGEDSDERVL